MRIQRNLDGVARKKATFRSWLKAKEQETQGMPDPLLSVTVPSETEKRCEKKSSNEVEKVTK